jgi:hypothetical protein
MKVLKVLSALIGLTGIFLFIAQYSSSTKNEPGNPVTTAFVHDSDLTVKSYLEINVDSNGHLPVNPYVLHFKAGKKSLLVIGTEHSSDTANKMFAIIEKRFSQFSPQIIINEGGNLIKTYPDKNTAIAEDDELGLEKFLADKAGIKTVCGDEPVALEFTELSTAFSAQEAIVYFGSERFVFPYLFGQYQGDFEKLYSDKFIEGYLKKRNVELTPEQTTFSYYKNGYKKWFGYSFHIDSIRQSQFIPFNTSHHFCEVSRKSKELRDRYLLKEIRRQLEQHDRVMVVYGGWHVLAIEPALHQLMSPFGMLFATTLKN